jgi:signal transduction histidine kinase/CheY-like chemotaxis protein
MSGGSDDARRLAEAEELARMGVWEWDVTKNELWWSAELFRILGVATYHKPSFELWLSNVHPDDLSTVKAHFTRARRERGEHAIEYRVIEPGTGLVKTIQARLRSTTDRVIGVDQDSTANKEVAARVVFSDRMVSIGTLAGGVAHEINNPLATIAANLQLLAECYDTSLIETSLEAVDRIRSVVRGLTAFSRHGADNHTTIDPARALEIAISLSSSEIRHRAKLITELQLLPFVQADAAKLGQVFINLLVNAAEAIKEGNANENEIAVRTHTDAAGWAVIEISDTGGGIPRDISARIFDPFFTTKPVGQGTGLGLSICHGIVRSLGGDIAFRTERGKGTTFTVALPPSTDRITPPPPTRTITANLQRRGSVLIVDDEVAFATSLRRVLTSEHDVSVVASGREALARITSGERFDVILCDLMMPEMTGAELHAALVETDADQAERMIFITGGAFTPTSQAFLERVTNRSFEKPCDLGVLRAAIRALVGAG